MMNKERPGLRKRDIPILFIKLLINLCAKSLQLCLTLCNPMNYNQTGASVHGTLQARIIEWVAISTEDFNSHLGISCLWHKKRVCRNPQKDDSVCASIYVHICVYEHVCLCTVGVCLCTASIIYLPPD